MRAYELNDLVEWDQRIREKVAAFGLDCFPQEFEICDHNQMLGYMAYSGMPSHYPHWSYGKAYEKLKTLYDHGVAGLPYEMVINSNPALAYLMRDNTLALQILTIAHVYAHNDFFKNNFTLQSTHPEYVIGTMKSHGQRVWSYIESPSIGIDRVEQILDAAHALALQCRRNLAVRKLTEGEQRQRKLEAASPREDPFAKVHKRQPVSTPDLHKVPLEPEEDLLLFIRDHNPYLEEWERDLLTIVHEEAQYFIPQIETKIMNEGWATFWHKRLLESLELPQDLHLEFLVRHNQVVRPIAGSLNPYHIGWKIWEDLYRRYEQPEPDEEESLEAGVRSGLEKVFSVRAADRDASFLRRHLTEKLVRELRLFEYRVRGGDWVVTEVADDEGWQQIKETLIRSVGMNSVPVIKVEDADFGHQRTLLLVHEHDGRDLHLEYAEKSLGYVHQLWGRDVALQTIVNGKKVLLQYGERGFTTRQLTR